MISRRNVVEKYFNIDDNGQSVVPRVSDELGSLMIEVSIQCGARMERCVQCVAVLCGCGRPNAANIELRKQNEDLRNQVQRLEADHGGDLARIKMLQSEKWTVPTRPQDRLDRLFTTRGVRIQRLTGISGNTLKVYVVPIDAAGDTIKAAGAFTVQLYNLNDASSPLIGKWDFSNDQARKSWYGDAMLYEYVLTCPLSSTVATDRATVHVSFIDELTGAIHEAQKEINILPASRPSR